MRVDEFDCILMEMGVLTKYKIPPYVKLIYDSLAEQISVNEGYTSKFLQLPIEADSEFLIRGLILDYVHGNVLRLGAGGYIIVASHGSVALEEADIDRYYPGRRWYVADQLFGNSLNFLKGNVSNKLMVLLSYFEIAIGLVFIRIVDTIDVITQVNVKNYLFAYDSITVALQQVLHKTDGYFTTLLKNPNVYLHKCDEVTVNWLTSLKQPNKYLILFSEWTYEYTKNVLRFILGPTWNRIFNCIICDHNKISFFMKMQKFEKLNIGGDSKLKTKFYVDGNWIDLSKYILRMINKTHLKVLSFGSDLILDTYLQRAYVDGKHILVLEELNAETPSGLKYDAPFDKVLTSQMWGSYFRKEGCDMLLGTTLVRRYSSLVTAGIEDIASYSLETDLPTVPF